MFDNEYEEYMRSVLGYPMSGGTYYVGQSMFPYRNIDCNKNYSHLYPEIYNKLKPIIHKVCNSYGGMNVLDGDIEAMVTQIYDIYEAGEETSSCNKNVGHNGANEKINSSTSKENNCSVINSNKCNYNANKSSTTNISTQRPSKYDDRQSPLLRDLIKILLINQLINNNSNKPSRPPINQYPPYGIPQMPRETQYGTDIY